jgi:hypothetical protein
MRGAMRWSRHRDLSDRQVEKGLREVGLPKDYTITMRRVQQQPRRPGELSSSHYNPLPGKAFCITTQNLHYNLARPGT